MNAPTPRPIAQVTKITLKNLGEPSLIKLQPETVREMMLGTLYGMAEGFVERAAPDGSGQKFEGLKGAFRAIPADPNKEPEESAILFIPDAFYNGVADLLRSQQKTDPSARLNFIFEVYVIRANNPQGYSWKFVPAKQYTKSPLDELVLEHQEIRRLVPPAGVKAIAGGKK
jgi:hypothetical protein